MKRLLVLSLLISGSAYAALTPEQIAAWRSKFPVAKPTLPTSPPPPPVVIAPINPEIPDPELPVPTPTPTEVPE